STAFAPMTAPLDFRFAFHPSTVREPNLWQPLRYVDGTGTLVTPRFVGAHWQRVTPFALTSSAQQRSPNGPALYGSSEFVEQAEALLEISAGLTDEERVIALYWADGPRSELP